VARVMTMWQERRQRGKRDINVARPTLSSKMIFFFFLISSIICDNMDNFVHNAANRTSEFLHYVLVSPAISESTYPCRTVYEPPKHNA
jgi:hypothetical protein